MFALDEDIVLANGKKPIGKLGTISEGKESEDTPPA